MYVAVYGCLSLALPPSLHVCYLNELSDGEMKMKEEETNDCRSTPHEEPPDRFMSSTPNSSVFDHGPPFDKFVSLPHIHGVSNLVDGLFCCDQMEPL